jgi:hypothetical protein
MLNDECLIVRIDQMHLQRQLLPIPIIQYSKFLIQHFYAVPE